MTSGIYLNSNISSLNAQRRLGNSTTSIAQSFTRLSSGLRINKASDDAAGLAIVSGLNTDRRVYNQGVRNLNDGLSMANIADSAIESLSNIVLRLSELAEQAANGTLGKEQREAIDEEAQSLAQEYFRIAQTAEFNGMQLLDGTMQEVRLQAGYGVEGGLVGSFGGIIGTGEFEEQSFYTAESSATRAVSLGDLNGDGNMDIVTAGSGSEDLNVFLGQGDGSFENTASYSEGFTYTDITLADLNGDGVLDMAYSLLGGGVSTRFGNDDGSFGASNNYDQFFLTDGTNALSTADLNNDGHVDIVAAGIDYGRPVIMLNQGDGSFSVSAILDFGYDLQNDVALADLNGDGTIDIATASQFGSVLIYSGNGDGTFSTPPTSYGAEASGSNAIAIGDLNGDGVLDIVSAGDNGPGEASIFIGQGDGTFNKFASYVTEAQVSRTVRLGDINGDGNLDMVTVGDSGPGEASVFIGQGDGNFRKHASLTTDTLTSFGAELGDVNGDLVPDLVTGGDSGPGEISIFLATTQSGTSPLLPFDLSTMAGARQALPVFKQKLSQLAAQRGEIGAYQARIGVAVNNLQAASENFASAESQIRDADVAEESARLVKNQILQQTGAAVLAQANQQPALVLGLLAAI